MSVVLGKLTAPRQALIKRLYADAENLFADRQVQKAPVRRERSSSTDPDGCKHVKAVVTDEETGFFVQLTGKWTGAILDGPFLVFGKKYLEETKSPQLSNTGVKLWP
jgi:hypothetical protein